MTSEKKTKKATAKKGKKALFRAITRAIAADECLPLTDEHDEPVAIVVPWEDWTDLTRQLTDYDALRAVADELNESESGKTAPPTPPELVDHMRERRSERKSHPIPSPLPPATPDAALLDWGTKDMPPEERADFEAWWRQKHGEDSDFLPPEKIQ
jgi:hypothetical protein